MLTSELIESLKESLATHGDLPVVSGCVRSGYGEPVMFIHLFTDTQDSDSVVTPVIDLVLSDESLVACGGF
jgi:hypothetical protein